MNDACPCAVAVVGGPLSSLPSAFSLAGGGFNDRCGPCGCAAPNRKIQQDAFSIVSVSSALGLNGGGSGGGHGASRHATSNTKDGF